MSASRSRFASSMLPASSSRSPSPSPKRCDVTAAAAATTLQSMAAAQPSPPPPPSSTPGQRRRRSMTPLSRGHAGASNIAGLGKLDAVLALKGTGNLAARCDLLAIGTSLSLSTKAAEASRRVAFDLREDLYRLTGGNNTVLKAAVQRFVKSTGVAEFTEADLAVKGGVTAIKAVLAPLNSFKGGRRPDEEQDVYNSIMMVLANVPEKAERERVAEACGVRARVIAKAAEQASVFTGPAGTLPFHGVSGPQPKGAGTRAQRTAVTKTKQKMRIDAIVILAIQQFFHEECLTTMPAPSSVVLDEVRKRISTRGPWACRQIFADCPGRHQYYSMSMREMYTHFFTTKYWTMLQEQNLRECVEVGTGTTFNVRMESLSYTVFKMARPLCGVFPRYVNLSTNFCPPPSLSSLKLSNLPPPLLF